ncbi:MAG: HNH endonuclease [Kiritimatiellia bacterium]
METQSNRKVIPLDYIRGLLVAQGGRCAITGMPLDPQDVNADHIVPLSREELSPTKSQENIWLVHKKVNAMKGTMTYTEFLQMCQMVLDHRIDTIKLLGQITEKQISPMSKSDFDVWVSSRCDESGRIRREQSGEGCDP